MALSKYTPPCLGVGVQIQYINHGSWSLPWTMNYKSKLSITEKLSTEIDWTLKFHRINKFFVCVNFETFLSKCIKISMFVKILDEQDSRGQTIKIRPDLGPEHCGRRAHRQDSKQCVGSGINFRRRTELFV